MPLPLMCLFQRDVCHCNMHALLILNSWLKTKEHNTTQPNTTQHNPTQPNTTQHKSTHNPSCAHVLLLIPHSNKPFFKRVYGFFFNCLIYIWVVDVGVAVQELNNQSITLFSTDATHVSTPIHCQVKDVLSDCWVKKFILLIIFTTLLGKLDRLKDF